MVFAGNVDALSKRAGVHIDGLLGQDVLRHFKQISIIHLDHPSGTVTFLSTFQLPYCLKTRIRTCSSKLCVAEVRHFRWKHPR
jgi:hypothetical protein